jgi:protein MpaA
VENTPSPTSPPPANEPARPTQTPRALPVLPTTAPQTSAPVLPTYAPPLTDTPFLLVGGGAPPDDPVEAGGAASTLPQAVSLDTVATLLPVGDTFIVGQSAGGRDILVWRFGAGEHTLLLIGGIHAGYESNTVVLVNQMIEHFRTTPGDILPGMTLVLVPAANPDGLALGRQAAGRFNGRNVDLNRNWACDWAADAYWREQKVNPGPAAFSEPESQALARLVRDLHPGAVVFYHSAANGVFAGECMGDHGSLALAAVLGTAAGYPYGQPFTAYTVTGTASSWVDGQGIPSVDLELTTTQDSEFVRNLRAVMAAQCWLIGPVNSASVPACR